MAEWNPWHGCIKYSAGCQNCYVYRRDARYDKDASQVYKTTSFDLPIRKDKHGNYKIKSGERVWTCFTSDFFLDIADPWRNEAWDMMRKRSDLYFFFITKRIDRFYDCIPADWANGYPNVAICATIEDQAAADLRLPILKQAPIRYKSIAAEPLLEAIDISAYLGPVITKVVVGGESGPNARPMDYNWVLNIREQCLNAQVPFYFKQTGACFIKDGRKYHILRKDQSIQARKAGLTWPSNTKLG
jgi:protein gp37